MILSYGILEYSTTHTSEEVYIIGGLYTENIVAKFRNNSWTRLRDLRQGRYNHGSIFHDGQSMIIGGCHYGPEE